MWKDIARLYISSIILAGFLYITVLYLTGKVINDPATSSTVGQILGNWGILAAGVAGFWVGSSKGSEDKTSTMDKMTDKLPNPPAQTTVTTTTSPIPPQSTSTTVQTDIDTTIKKEPSP